MVHNTYTYLLYLHTHTQHRERERTASWAKMMSPWDKLTALTCHPTKRVNKAEELAMDKLQLTGRHLGLVFKFRWPFVWTAFLVLSVKLSISRLKTQPKQLLCSLPLVIALPELTYLSTNISGTHAATWWRNLAADIYPKYINNKKQPNL
jgi:hypothetical protein